jgi:hypothetical protein
LQNRPQPANNSPQNLTPKQTHLRSLLIVVETRGHHSIFQERKFDLLKRERYSL